MSSFARKVQRNYIRKKYGNKLVKPVKTLISMYVKVENIKGNKKYSGEVKLLRQKMQVLNEKIDKYIKNKEENIKRMKGLIV